MGLILSLDEVISRVDRRTSPGYPWNLKWKTKGQALDEGLEIFRELIGQIMETGSIEYNFEVRPGFVITLRHVYYMTSGKGELRTVDKLLAVDPKDRKTRTFMPGCLLLHLVSLMLYGDQNDKMLSMAGEREWSAVGMTPWYGGWNSMATYLSSETEKPISDSESKTVTECLRDVVDGEEKEVQAHADSGRSFMCCDVKHMESSLNDAVQTNINATRNECLAWGNDLMGRTPESKRCINMLTWYQEQSTQLYIIGVNGWLYFRTCVNPSGKLNTLMDNTLALMLVFLYVIACRVNSVAEVLAVYSRTPAKMMGDDSIVQYKPWLRDLITRARDMGFDFRLECPISPLADAVFLNAGFHWTGSMWLFRPNFDKIRASVLFLFKAKSWRLCYVKVCAYRQLCFPYPEYRAEADKMLGYIYRHHDDEMRGETAMDARITYESARAALMNDSENRFLCTGLERAGGLVFVPSPVAEMNYTRIRPERLELFDEWVEGWCAAATGTLD
jgi:hypothetical protein